MNKNKFIGGVILLGVCSAALIAVETPSEPVKTKSLLSEDMRHDVSRYTVGYLKKENDASEIVIKANDLFQKGEYVKARDLYINARKRLTNLNPDYFRDRIKFCADQINMCYYEIANQALAKADASAAVNDYDEAIRLCREAADYYPECRPVMEKKIARYNEIRRTVAINRETSTEALLPDKEAQEYEISILLRRARSMVNAGLYDKAKRIYEQILVKNPYRSDVLQDLRAVNAYIDKRGIRRSISSARAAITANELEWALPIQGTVKKTEQALDTPVEKVVVEDSTLTKKLKAIIIPRIEFEDIKLRTVLATLASLSEKNDPAGVGVNIFLRQNLGAGEENAGEGGGAAAAPAPAAENEEKKEGEENNENNDDAEDTEDVDEEEGEGGEEDESSWTALEKTSLSLPPMVNKSLEEILRSICANAKLRYRVEKYAVVVEELNMPETDMITKIFPIDPTSFTDFDPANSDELMSYFKSQGIAFPAGSKVVFDAKISRIFATNTSENLDKIEAACSGSLGSGESGESSSDTLVQIQLRVVEISQTDLNALGFNYTLKDNSSNSPIFENMSTANQLRDAGGANGGPNAHAAITMGEFSLGVDVKALNDLTSKDVLASPRVTTLPDEKVEIKLVTETYFVEDFDDSEYDTDQSEDGSLLYTFVGPFPNFDGSPTELGISFSTTPSINLKDRLITMDVNPNIKTLIGWTYYHGTNDDGADETIRTPIFSNRNIKTNVTVRDGETLVLGGVIEDNVSTIKDKVPLLGDIPLLGRLFQSRSRSSEKKNLLIFVTPRLVKTDGTLKFPEYHESSRGIAKFL